MPNDPADTAPLTDRYLLERVERLYQRVAAMGDEENLATAVAESPAENLCHAGQKSPRLTLIQGGRDA